MNLKHALTLLPVVLLAACQPSTLPTVTAGDAAAQVHRLRVGVYVSGDGVRVPLGMFWDTALNDNCESLSDEHGVHRCFPTSTVPYNPRSYLDDACTQEVLLARTGQEGTLQGVVLSLDNNYPMRLHRAGSPVAGTGYWNKGIFAQCEVHPVPSGYGLYALGPDVTSTLETLEFHWVDAP